MPGMPGTIEKASEWAHSHQGRKMLRYTMVSVISTAVSFVSLAVLFGLKIIPSQVEATVTANAIATVPSYYLNRTWAWGKSGRSHLTKEILPFWMMACVGIVVSIGGAWVAKHISLHYGLSHFWSTILVLVANVLSFGIFWVLKLLLFNRLFHTELEEFEEHLTAEEQAAAG